MMTDPSRGTSRSRPAVSVVVPFFGDEDAGRATLAGLAGLWQEPGDELIVVDNTPDAILSGLSRDGVRVVTAVDERSSYHARNVGAERASCEWLLFTDADCRPPADLLDAFFQRPVDGSTGVIAGAINPAAGDHGLFADWADTREILRQQRSMEGDAPAGATACLLVRRCAWAAVGGFQEGVRSGGDLEFCWRVAERGFGLEMRPEAAVGHLHRGSLRGVARQMARYAAGNAWQERRRPGSAPRPRALPAVVRSVGGAVWFASSLRPRRAVLKLIDGVAALAQAIGRGLGNSVVPNPRRRPDPARQALVVATDRFPVPSETFIRSEIAALQALGWELRVEAIARPDRPALGGARGLGVRYLEDEGVLGRIAATAWLMARHPLRSAADRLGRSKWDPEERLPLSAIAPQARRLAMGGERHVHVHFAAMAAVNSLRAGKLVGLPVSIAAHGHELFVTPRALPEKLTAASFVAAPCEYTARHLSALAPSGAEGRIHTVVMGVDGARFRRSKPYPGGRTVLAVGRLVEKKGLGTLIDAVARLEAERPIERLRIVGDGPLRSELERRVERAGLSTRVEFLGSLPPSEVRDAMDGADVVAVPCVIASDGDRDAMPVVAKEALAMEVPVAATREVGLPEVIDARWGRLVPPGDAAALAEAIAELLALPPEQRAEMGSAGRTFVLERFGVRSQAELLADLIVTPSEFVAGQLSDSEHRRAVADGSADNR